MVETTLVRGYVMSRIQELTAEGSRLETKLRLFRGFSHVAVLSGIIVPMLAGSALVTEGGVLASFKDLVAVAVFVTGGLTALHKGLDCEAYHVECIRSIHELRSLVEGFQAVVTLEGDQAGSALADLEARLQRYRERASDIPPRLSTRVAERLLQLAGKPSS